MRALFLIQGFDVPSSRYRVLQYLPHLKAAGIDATVTPFPETLLEQQRAYGTTAAEYDLVFLHRKRLSKFWIKTLRATAKKIAYDFDDAVMFRDTLSLSDQESERRRRRFERTCRMVDLVLAGNRYLASFAEPLNANTHVLPTVVDLAKYASRAWVGTPQTVTLGWIGDTGSYAYLDGLRPVFEAIGREVPNVQLKVVSSRFPRYESLPVVPKRWKAEEELADLQSFDIGIMPLPDDPWSKGKCGLKLLQYMGAGVPVVCAPVGVNAEIVKDGVQGLHASSPEEWVAAVRKLASDAALRARMGKAAFERVKAGYSLQSAAPRLAALLKATIQPSSSP